MISLTEQLAFVKRELATRHPAYLNAVRTGVAVRKSAERDLDVLVAIVGTLDKLIGLEEVSKTMRDDLQKPKIKPEELFG